MTFPEWMQAAALVILAVAIAWALGILAGPWGYGWPAGCGALAVQLLGIGLLLERRGGGEGR